MDKDNNDKGKFIKLDNKDRKLLRSIDKSSKWEDVKAIKDINDEIINLDIYKDFIGLGCSRYLNESAETGKLDIEDMFRNCREAEKVRVRVNKKEKKEIGKKGKSGLGKGNIGNLIKGNDKSIKDVDSKQGKEEPKKENVIITKAKEIAKGITDALTKGKNKDGWKGAIAKYGLGVGLDTLFGIVIGYMEYAINNPVGAIGIGSTALGIIGSIYSYVIELEDGKKIIGNITDWIKGKMNELYDYLMGNDIKVIKKGKKKKPFDRGGGGSKKDDDDDDDDDDSDSDDFNIDFDELEEYSNENDITETEERTEKKSENAQDLTGETETKKTSQMNNLETILPFLLQQQSQQQNQNLVNTNTDRLFQQNAVNPTPTPTQTETPTPEKNNIPPQEEEPIQEQKAENLNPEYAQRPTRGGMFSGMGQGSQKEDLTGKTLTGREGLKDFAKDAFGAYSMYKMGSKLYEAMGSPFTDAGEVLGQPQMGQTGTGVGGTGQEFFDAQQAPTNPFSTFNTPRQFRNDRTLRTPAPNTQPQSLLPESGSIQPRYNRQDSLTQTDITRTNLTPEQQDIIRNAREKLKQQERQINEEKQRKQEEERKVQDYIDNMGLNTGMSAGGLYNPNLGKTSTDALSSLFYAMGVKEKVKTMNDLQSNIMVNVKSRVQQEEQQGLLQDIQQQAEQTRLNAVETARQSQLLESENERLKAEMSLIRAREGLEEERKMTAKEAEIMEEQQQLEIKQKQAKELKEYEEMLKEQEEERKVQEQEQMEMLLRANTRGERFEEEDEEEEEEVEVPKGYAEAQQAITGKTIMIKPKRGRKKGQTSSKMREGMRKVLDDDKLNNYTFKQLLLLNNPIITEYINELKSQPRPSGMNKLYKAEGLELLRRLE